MSREVTSHTVGVLDRSGRAVDGNIASDPDLEEKCCKLLALLVTVVSERDNIKSNTTDVFGSPDPEGGVVEVARVVEVASTAILVGLGADAGMEKVPCVVEKKGVVKPPVAIKIDLDYRNPHKIPDVPKEAHGNKSRLITTLHTEGNTIKRHANSTIGTVPLHDENGKVIKAFAFEDSATEETILVPTEVAVIIDDVSTEKPPEGEKPIKEETPKGSRTGTPDGLTHFAHVALGSIRVGAD